MAFAAVQSKAVVRYWLLLPLWDSVTCFVVRYFVSILVLQSSWWGRERWLLCLVCLPGVSWLLCVSFLRCQGFVCSLWLWYVLIIPTIFRLLLYGDVSVVFRLIPVNMQLNIPTLCVAMFSIDLLFSLLPKFADVCVILPTLVFIMTSLPWYNPDLCTFLQERYEWLKWSRKVHRHKFITSFVGLWLWACSIPTCDHSSR